VEASAAATSAVVLNLCGQAVSTVFRSRACRRSHQRHRIGALRRQRGHRQHGRRRQTDGPDHASFKTCNTHWMNLSINRCGACRLRLAQDVGFLS
jgi:hypothetical protein